MSVWLCIVCLPAWAQNANAPDLEAQAAAVKVLVEKAPKSALERTQIQLQAPAAGWEIGYPSAVTMDDAGTIYVLQRGEKADPLLVLNRDGKIVRSWGKGLYKIPHSIRIDPQGNIWTVDSGSSMVLKFSPQGEKLMEISVGEQPAGRARPTEPATSRSDRMGESTFPTATATRACSNTTPRANASGSGAVQERVRGSSTSRTGLRWTIRESFT